jgi:four helix bundle protein
MHLTDLDAWKIGTELVQEVNTIIKKFPESERHGLASQLRRSSKSILGNIAEGFGKRTSADKAHKYTIARGESTETEAHLRIAVALEYLTSSEANKAIGLARQMSQITSGMIRRFQSVPVPVPEPEIT